MPLLERWARFSYRHRWLVLGAWILLLIGFGALSQLYGGQFENSFSLPGSDAQRGIDLLEERFPSHAGEEANLVFEAEQGVASPEIRARIETLLAEIAELEDVVAIESPYDAPGFISQTGTIARANVHWSTPGIEADPDQVNRMFALIDGAAGDGLRIEAGGDVVAATEFPEFGSEIIGLAAAVVILFVAFGSVVAMGLPIGAALFGVGTGTALVMLMARAWSLPDFTAPFTAMIGIGVGIDYSLLVVTRYREGLHANRSVEDSIALAVATAGRSVIFAGAVVVIAFFGLYAMGLPFLALAATAASLMVAMAVIVAITLLPAMLAIVGRNVHRWRVPLLHSSEGVDTRSIWHRFARQIQRHPAWWALGASAILVVATIPVFSVQLGFTDYGNNPESYRSRRAYDLLAEGFGPGFNGPLIVVFETNGAEAEDLERVAGAIASDPNVALVAPPQANPEGDVVLIPVFPLSSPQDQETVDLVHRLRDEVLPAATQESGLEPLLTGSTAANVDATDRINSRMPILLTAVIGLSFILLMTVFRSILVAVKAAIMNLLSIGASLGVVVAVFQWGWGAELLDVSPGPIETFIPMMAFAILFGLSMDYEVFLISRVREEYVRHGENSIAVAHGLAATARVISAAAAIMVAVFLAFVLGQDRIVKELGLGLATAIFIDATIIRLILVPATMELLGHVNWWLPGWLDRLLPQVNIEGTDISEPAQGAASPAGGK